MLYHTYLFIFCVKAALLAKRATTCDKVEISGIFDRRMSQQCCEWISDKCMEMQCDAGCCDAVCRALLCANMYSIRDTGAQHGQIPDFTVCVRYPFHGGACCGAARRNHHVVKKLGE